MFCSSILFAENSGNHFKCDHCHHDSGEKWVGGWVWLVVGEWWVCHHHSTIPPSPHICYELCCCFFRYQLDCALGLV